MSRHRHRNLLLALCCLLVGPGVARAATVIASSIKTASPLTAANIAAIDKAVADQVGKMKGNPDQQLTGAARQTLIDDADTPAGGATPEYQKQYISSVTKALAPLLSGQNKQDAHNAAIVIGGVAAKVERNNVADLLAPEVKSMMASPDTMIAYWGVKAAKFVIADNVANTGSDGGLGKLVIDEVQKADKGGILIDEAYSGLTLEVKGSQFQTANAKLVLPMLLDLLEWRISLYKVAPPANPQAESAVTGFLPVQAWSTLSANTQERDRAMKDIGDLACSQLHALASGYEPDMGEAARGSGNAIGALAIHLNNNPDLAGLNKTIFSAIGPNMDTSRVEENCSKIKDAFKKVGIELSAP